MADAAHLAAVVALLGKGLRAGSFDKLFSAKSQTLLLLCYCCRYVEMFVYGFAGQALYTGLLRLAWTCVTAATVALMVLWRPLWAAGHVKEEVEEDNDVMPIPWLLVTAAVLAVLTVRALRVVELLWAFSVFGEALCFVPQYVLLERANPPEERLVFIRLYLAAFAVYRLLSLVSFAMLAAAGEWREVAKATLVCGALLSLALYALWLLVPQLFSPETNRAAELRRNAASAPAMV
jgi:hypothetical protein